MGFIDSFDTTETIKEGKWRHLASNNKGTTLLQDMPPVRGSRPTTSAHEVKNIMKTYVNSMEDSVSL